jgi:hypothetical protein
MLGVGDRLRVVKMLRDRSIEALLQPRADKIVGATQEERLSNTSCHMLVMRILQTSEKLRDRNEQ